MDRTHIVMHSKMNLDASPHFRLDCSLKLDNCDEDQMHALNGGREQDRYVKIRVRFHNLHSDEKQEHEIAVKTDRKITPSEMMKACAFISLRRFLNDAYGMSAPGQDGDPAAERFLADTIGFCYHHSFQRILRDTWTQKHLTEELRVDVTGGNGQAYHIDNDEILQDPGGPVGTLYFCPAAAEGRGKPVELYYDEFHLVHADVASFADYFLAFGMIPAFFEKYLPEAEQRKEAVRRLRFLGVSAQETEAFEQDGAIPVVETRADGSIRRGTQDDWTASIPWRWRYSYILRPLRGGLPYLLFRSAGAILMDAYLYVEALREDGESDRAQLKENARNQIVSAIVFNRYDEYELGSIEVELTEDGPVRVG